MRAFHEVRNYRSDFKVWHGAYRGLSFIAHWHREIELIYMRSGSAEIHIANHTFTVRAGDLIVCDSGDIHYGNCHSDNSCLDFLLFDTEIIGSHYQYNYFESPVVTRSRMVRYGLAEKWKAMLHVLDSELKDRNPYYQDIVKSEIRSFWYSLVRILPVSIPQGIMENRQAALLTRFQELLSYMEEHSQDNLSLNDAAHRMGFSPCYFSRLFRQLTGFHFIKYLNIIRTTHAASLLMKPDRKLTDIALICGFNNIRTFNRVFRDITGLTPTEYINQPENRSDNFTYYRSSSGIETRAEENPTILRKYRVEL
jgi:AraC-like DNA-binding protein